MHQHFLVVLGVFMARASCTEPFDPLEMYMDDDVGMALVHPGEEPGTKMYDMFSYCSSLTEYCHTPTNAFFGYHNEKDNHAEEYNIKTDKNRMMIHSSLIPHEYHVDLNYWDMFDIRWNHEDTKHYTDRRTFMRVRLTDEVGTIALQCRNGKFLRRDDNESGGYGQFKQHAEPCTSNGICDKCLFQTEIGALHDYFINILAVEWLDPEGDIVKEPTTLASDVTDNYSDVPITNTFAVSYTDTTTDTTSWSRKWGYSYSTKVSVKVGFGDNGVRFSTSSTLTYSGTEGGGQSVTDSTTYTKSSRMRCPAKTRCILELAGRQLDNAAIPFIATVSKSDGFKNETWQEPGVWYGVKVYDTHTIFRTEPLEDIE